MSGTEGLQFLAFSGEMSEIHHVRKLRTDLLAAEGEQVRDGDGSILLIALGWTCVLRKNYRRDLKRARFTNLKEETRNKRHPSMMKFCSLWLNLFGDLLHFLVLSLRSKSSLAAENLFLRKQLAFYQERKIKPRRTSHPARLALLWLSR